MAEKTIDTMDYKLLKEFNLEIEVKEQQNFSFAFWAFLVNDSTVAFPSTLIKQVLSGIGTSAPFLVIDKKKITVCAPLHLLHKELNYTHHNSLTELPHTSVENELSSAKWLHVGFEVCSDVCRLHINGDVAGEQPFSSLPNKDSNEESSKITLVGADVDEGLKGYLYKAEVLPSDISVKDHYLKDPPLQLVIKNFSTSEIEEGSDGIWTIVGGKASCRRIFSLDVVLSNAFNQTVNMDAEVVAALLYEDSGLPVEKTSDDESPLLTSYDGIEFDSCSRPNKLLHGRASFKLKVSQLSSKCENRLFRIKFEIPKFRGFYFLEAFSNPIHCISRSRNLQILSPTWKRLPSGIFHFNGAQPAALVNGSVEVPSNYIHETKASPSSKRVKLGQEKTSVTDQLDQECTSNGWTTDQFKPDLGIKSDQTPKNLEKDNLSVDSERTEERRSDFTMTPSSGYSLSGFTVFKYCLGSLTERALLLKEVATACSEEDLLRFADEVSLYSGCSHHCRQIVIAKRLIEEGTKIWNAVAQDNHHVAWGDMILKIEEHFKQIATCTARSLSDQDFELLRRITGCQDYMAQEHFEKLWCWLYPVAFTLNRDKVNTTWNTISPKWIEGFITKEEAEFSLRDPRGLQEPGTFIVRFPTSRSWPHPDAGSLVVTYVGSDFKLHNKLLSVDYMYSTKENEMKTLQDMLLSEPELSHLGRMVRSQ